ncbi:hypothetical protein [Acinetobacter puyangensis]|uniref:hypothetical protein n=1 Tax=Acinetobacter puyangensis TaxID=1096779 RepID=UPI003A4D91DF
MNAESEVIIYAVSSVVDYLVERGVIDRQGINQHLDACEFELRKALNPDANEASEKIKKVFSTIKRDMD